MGKKEMRMSRLVEIINSRGYIPIKEIAQLLHVSEMSVRRDLAAVEKSGLVKNVNGVLVSNSGNTVQVLDKEYDLLNETQVQNEVKKLIGRFAATMIVPGDCVIFDTGTTTEQIAMAIPPEMDFEALCFTRNTLERLCRLPHVNIALAGGYYYPRTQLFAGEDGVNFIRSIRANKLFISAAGIHEDLGISCANSYEVPIKRAILQSAKQHILVADSSKFGVVRSAYFCDLEDIDIVITDTGLSPEWRNILQERGVTLYQV